AITQTAVPISMRSNATVRSGFVISLYIRSKVPFRLSARMFCCQHVCSKLVTSCRGASRIVRDGGANGGEKRVLRPIRSGAGVWGSVRNCDWSVGGDVRRGRQAGGSQRGARQADVGGLKGIPVLAEGNGERP